MTFAGRLIAVGCLATLALASMLSIAVASEPTHGLIEAAASENYFSIEPDFNGTSIILFGSVDQAKLKGDLPDIAITISGPEQPVTVWKKRQRGGIWRNSESFTFDAVPSFFATIASRPLEDIAPLEERTRFEIGLDALSFSNTADQTKSGVRLTRSDEFRAGLLRLKKANETFVENTDAIQWLGQRLFRAKINLPAAAGPGLYRARIMLLQNRKVIGETASQVTLQKVGIERFLSTSSTTEPWLYGMGAVLLAASLGLSASFVLRRT